MCVVTAETKYNHEAKAHEPVEVVMVMEAKTDSPDVEHKIREAFPDNWELMLAVAQAESELNQDAYNPEHHDGCQGSVGIFQIACVHVDDKELLKDVDYNISVAKRLYEKNGITIWGAYTDGRYKQYL